MNVSKKLLKKLWMRYGRSKMVIGLESFAKWFQGHENEYAIIGGTACDLLMSEGGLDFRATKDIDLVLIVEALTPEFGEKFWEYIVQAEYEHKNKSTGKSQFYRFSHPKSKEYPFMIELFTRHSEKIQLPQEAVLTPLPLEGDLSSLSAILLDDEYYKLLCNGRTMIDGITILDAGYLILFKAKAWLDLSFRKTAGEHVDSKNLRKHKNDIFRLSTLLGRNLQIPVSAQIMSDFQSFLHAMREEQVDVKQLGLSGTKEKIMERLETTYYIEENF